MMQYCNGLIGKHFKTLMQTIIFHVHGIVGPDQFTLIKAIGSLGALLWIPEIEDMDGYLVCRSINLDIPLNLQIRVLA
jgi:hypothetical protein